jgi:hypothetical protein
LFNPCQGRLFGKGVWKTWGNGEKGGEGMKNHGLHKGLYLIKISDTDTYTVKRVFNYSY